MKYFLPIFLLILAFSFNSCVNKKSAKEVEENDIEVVLSTEEEEDVKSLVNEDVVFYNMFSPVDLSNLIDAKNTYFNSSYINPLNNITAYSTSQKVALNTGVYGADLSYLWMFDQTQQALSYLSAIQHLTTKLGIPDNFVKSTFKLAEASSDQQDSLIQIVRNAYNETDSFLKESSRESAAVFILLGGWIETLYIALNIYSTPNSQFASKIITQKYSLNSLITMVQNTQDDIVMSEYLLLLKKLQDAFNSIELKLSPSDIDIDTANKRITIKNTSNLNIEPDQFNEIKTITTRIRTHIVD